MGFWKSGRGINGDSWADKMGNCMKALQVDTVEGSQTYPDEVHEITLAEFADVLEFCTRGHLAVHIDGRANAAMPLSELHSNPDTKTFSNRGQIKCETSPRATRPPTAASL